MSDTQDAPWRALPEWPAFVEAAGWVLEESGTTEVLLGRADALCAAAYAQGQLDEHNSFVGLFVRREDYEAERARAERLLEDA